MKKHSIILILIPVMIYHNALVDYNRSRFRCSNAYGALFCLIFLVLDSRLLAFKFSFIVVMIAALFSSCSGLNSLFRTKSNRLFSVSLLSIGLLLGSFSLLTL